MVNDSNKIYEICIVIVNLVCLTVILMPEFNMYILNVFYKKE